MAPALLPQAARRPPGGLPLPIRAAPVARPKGQSPGRPPDARIHATAQPGTALSRRRWTVAFGVAPRADRAGAVRGEDGPAARAHAAARKLEGVVSRTERGPGPSSTPDSLVVSCRSERSACWVRAVQGSWAGGCEFTRCGRQPRGPGLSSAQSRCHGWVERNFLWCGSFRLVCGRSERVCSCGRWWVCRRDRGGGQLLPVLARRCSLGGRRCLRRITSRWATRWGLRPGPRLIRIWCFPITTESCLACAFTTSRLPARQRARC
jgi:hypothetical protein